MVGGKDRGLKEGIDLGCKWGKLWMKLKAKAYTMVGPVKVGEEGSHRRMLGKPPGST